jgi:hypothetical protein
MKLEKNKIKTPNKKSKEPKMKQRSQQIKQVALDRFRMPEPNFFFLLEGANNWLK